MFYLNKHFLFSSHQQIVIHFFISPSDCNEVPNIISSLDNHKTVAPNYISTNILKLLNKDISNQLTSITSFNVSVSTKIFPNTSKTNKIIPTNKEAIN